ncbi:MAG: SLC13 family permease [Bacillota bacterium]|nr:SLC13 family permease [Bacillota bacterium]MDW7678253.1 SLC13 family permease [Bacillota bacterium]
MKKATLFLGTLVIPAVIILTTPFGLTLQQSILFSAVLLTVTWWATGIFNKNIASVFLLAVFLLVSDSSLQTIFRFPLSTVFLLLASAFLLGDGITRSHLASRIAQVFLSRYGRSPRRLISLSFLLGLVLVLVIPHPFPRVIILTSIYTNYLKNHQVDQLTGKIILFSIYAASSVTSMVLLNGDVVLNHAAVEFSGVNLGWTDWATYMAVPTVICSVFVFFLLILLFRSRIHQQEFSSEEKQQTRISKGEIKALLIMSGVLLGWATDMLHGIDPAWISLAGVLAMGFARLLYPSDLRKLNVTLFIFITAAFSIGGVLNESGVGKELFDQLVQIMPDPGSLAFYVFLVLSVMAVHMFIGSSVTTMAVMLPGLLSLEMPGVEPVAVTLIVYITVAIHFLLPFHHATMMIGAGSNHFSQRVLLQYGLMMTAATLAMILGIFLPWWRITGLL